MHGLRIRGWRIHRGGSRGGGRDGGRGRGRGGGRGVCVLCRVFLEMENFRLVSKANSTRQTADDERQIEPRDKTTEVWNSVRPIKEMKYASLPSIFTFVVRVVQRCIFIRVSNKADAFSIVTGVCINSIVDRWGQRLQEK